MWFFLYCVVLVVYYCCESPSVPILYIQLHCSCARMEKTEPTGLSAIAVVGEPWGSWNVSPAEEGGLLHPWRNVHSNPVPLFKLGYSSLSS